MDINGIDVEQTVNDISDVVDLPMFNDTSISDIISAHNPEVYLSWLYIYK